MMPINRDLDDRISRWLEAEAPTQVPDRAMRATFERTRGTRQQIGWQSSLRRTQMTRAILTLAAAASVLVVAVIGFDALVPQPGIGGQPSPTLSPIATSPSPTAEFPSVARQPDPEGVLPAGTYTTHPLAGVRRLIAEPNQSLTVTFTVPDGWQYVTSILAPAGEPGVGAPGGVSIQFFDVYSLHADPCDPVAPEPGGQPNVGPAVDDLVESLRARWPDEVTDPVDVTMGGYSGTQVDIVFPTQPSATEGCQINAGSRLWSTTALGIQDAVYASGPANRYQTHVLDVDGTRLVVVATDFPGTTPADRAELDAILGSQVIKP